eukprot:scaffold35580_cov20-Tisochrysis_lutea.AAC.1
MADEGSQGHTHLISASFAAAFLLLGVLPGLGKATGGGGVAASTTAKRCSFQPHATSTPEPDATLRGESTPEPEVAPHGAQCFPVARSESTPEPDVAPHGAHCFPLARSSRKAQVWLQATAMPEPDVKLCGAQCSTIVRG